MIATGAGEFLTFESRHLARETIAPHRHSAPYVALVLEGSYEEFSVDGVWACQPGDLVVHPAWHLHANRFTDRRSRVLNFRPTQWSASAGFLPARVCRVADLGPLMRRRRLGAESLADVLAQAEPREAQRPPALLARLAAALQQAPELGIAVLASQAGITREHASRTFRRHFGFTLRAYRAEARFRRALDLIRDGRVALATAAYEAGYADQAHFTRCIRAATSLTPGELRRRTLAGRGITFVQ